MYNKWPPDMLCGEVEHEFLLHLRDEDAMARSAVIQSGYWRRGPRNLDMGQLIQCLYDYDQDAGVRL